MVKKGRNDGGVKLLHHVVCHGIFHRHDHCSF
jgi:hypothetical protein